MITMNTVNGIRPTPSYVMPPEYTNNNYMTGSPGTFNNSLNTLQGQPAGAFNTSNNAHTLQGQTPGAFNTGNNAHTLQSQISGAFNTNSHTFQGQTPGPFNTTLLTHQGLSHNSDLNLSTGCSGNTVFTDGSAVGDGDGDEVCMDNCDEDIFDPSGCDGNDAFIQGTNCVYSAGTGQQSAQYINSQVPNSLTVGGGYFTFTSPTQSIYYSPAITSYTGTRLLQPRTMPQAFAPTSCLQWQHSVPQRIPWSACGPTAREQDILKFTGNNPSASAVTFTNEYSPLCSISQTFSPIPSCSHPPRRLKRSAPDSLSNPPFSSKVHLTEAMISKHMQGLQLENASSKSSDARPNSSVTDGSSSPTRRRWQKFQDLEDRLSLSDEEEDDANTDPGHPRLHIVEDIAKMVNSQPVIPKEIMDKMSKPRMELVLWQPPGGAIKELIESNKTSSQIAEHSDRSEPKLADIDDSHSLSMHSLPAQITERMEEEGVMDMDTNNGDFILYCS